MKILITLLLAVGSLSALAQKKSYSNLNTNIHDDGKNLSITIKANSNDHAIDYSGTYDVKGMTKAQKNALTKRITDSVCIGNVTPPSPPKSPAEPSPVTNTKSVTNQVHRDINDDGKTLHLKINGTNKNGSFNYDRVFKVQGMTTKEKNALINHVTDSLGLGKI